MAGNAQRCVVCRTIVNQTPGQAGGGGAVDHRKVAESVRHRFGVRTSPPTTGKYLKRSVGGLAAKIHQRHPKCRPLILVVSFGSADGAPYFP